MNRSVHNLLRLARKAYKPAPPPPQQSSPFGFSTRVAARWAESRQRTTADLWQRLCWWGATASLVVCLTAAVYRATLPELNAYELLLEEPATEVVDF